MQLLLSWIQRWYGTDVEICLIIKYELWDSQSPSFKMKFSICLFFLSTCIFMMAFLVHSQIPNDKCWSFKPSNSWLQQLISLISSIVWGLQTKLKTSCSFHLSFHNYCIYNKNELKSIGNSESTLKSFRVVKK